MNEPRLGPETEKALHGLLLGALENTKSAVAKMGRVEMEIQSIRKERTMKKAFLVVLAVVLLAGCAVMPCIEEEAGESFVAVEEKAANVWVAPGTITGSPEIAKFPRLFGPYNLGPFVAR